MTSLFYLYIYDVIQSPQFLGFIGAWLMCKHAVDTRPNLPCGLGSRLIRFQHFSHGLVLQNRWFSHVIKSVNIPTWELEHWSANPRLLTWKIQIYRTKNCYTINAVVYVRKQARFSTHSQQSLNVTRTVQCQHNDLIITYYAGICMPGPTSPAFIAKMLCMCTDSDALPYEFNYGFHSLHTYTL